MSNILGLLFSFVLIFPTIIFGVDLFLVNSITTALETKATQVGYQISQQGGLRKSLTEELAESGITITCAGDCSHIIVGEKITYQLIKYYTPMIISQEEMTISVTRTIIVGYL